MSNITLRKIQPSDVKHFQKWWKDNELIGLTSGDLAPISDKKIEENVLTMMRSGDDYHYMILADDAIIGHIVLIKEIDGWYETQIVIGEKEFWGRGYGSEAIKLLIEMMKKEGILNIFLEVRPDNERAIRAYEKCGFEGIKIIEHPDNPNLPRTLRMELHQDK